MTTPQMTLEKLFHLVDSIEPCACGCKLWPGRFRRRHSQTYPHAKINDKNMEISRWILERKLGRPIRPGYYALHTCDHSLCVNPDHLYEGTQSDNLNDVIQRHPHRSKLKSHLQLTKPLFKL
jgi:hypothetical protein